MIKTLEDFEISDVLSDSLRKDKNISALAAALTPIFKKIFEETKLIHMFEGVPDHLLDYIAYEEAADFYDVNMTNEQKRIQISKAESIHKTKGTVAAVEDVIAPFFHSGKVREWFEYEGKPYHFQVIANEYLQNEKDLVKLFRMVEVVKRKTTRLDCVIFERKDGIIQQAEHKGTHIEVYPLTGTFDCGVWEEPSTIGRIIDSGLQTTSQGIDKSISEYKLTFGFFANSNDSPEILQMEFQNIVQIERENLDYSNVEFIFANEGLMVGKFRLGSTEGFEQLQVDAKSDLSIEGKNDNSIQEDIARAGQFYIGSKDIFELIQKEYIQALETGMIHDMSFVEYMYARENLHMNFLVGSPEIFEQYTRSTSSSIDVTNNQRKTVTEYKITGQFFAGEGENS